MSSLLNVLPNVQPIHLTQIHYTQNIKVLKKIV